MFLKLRVSNLCKLLSSEKEWTTKKSIQRSKANTEHLLNERFHLIIETPEEAIEVFKPLLSQCAFELKWIKNNDAVNEAISKDLKPISNNKQFEVEPNTDGGIFSACTTVDSS